jgi:hypothetical protein
MDQVEKFVFLVKTQIYIHPESGLSINTLDNPGWSLKTTGKILPLEGRVGRRITDANWIIIRSLDGDYDAAGDQSKLPMIIEAYNTFFSSTDHTFQLPPANFQAAADSHFKRLGNWYSSHCNTDWEHCYGLRISFAAPSICRIKIDLAETNLEGEDLPDWLKAQTPTTFGYSVVKDVFHAEGTIPDFRYMLELFLAWAELSDLSPESMESHNEQTGGDTE